MREERNRAIAIACQALAPPGAGKAMPQPPYIVALRSVALLRASECVDQDQVLELAKKIQTEGQWTQPIPIDGHSGLVMDGNHRLRVAHLLGLRRLPCIPLSYEDPRVQVRCWKTGQDFERQRLSELARRELLLPFKTTRHSFSPCLPQSEIPLELLC